MLLQNALEGAVEFKTNMSNSYIMDWTELDRPTEIISKLSYSASFKELSHTALQRFLLLVTQCLHAMLQFPRHYSFF